MIDVVIIVFISLFSPAYANTSNISYSNGNNGIVDGLYSTVDDVLPLNNVTFMSTIIDTKPDNKVWAVEFYNSWCGHCKHFAPIWKALATELKDLKDVIGLAAIDCSQQRNLEICRKFDISLYPTLKIFPPIYNASRASSSVMLQSQSAALIKKSMFQVFADFPTPSWPTIKPLEKIENIWLEKNDAHKHVLLIFEDEDSTVGPEVMLDVRNIRNVLLRRMLKNDVAKFGINKFPSLYKVNKDSTYALLAVASANAEDGVVNRKMFVSIIHDLNGANLAQSGTVIRQVGGTAQPSGVLIAQKAKENVNSSKVTMQDLESALHYSLRQEVALMYSIEHERLEALKEYIHVLLEYFPGRKPVLGFLHQVYNMLNNLEIQSLTGEEWLEKIDRVQDADNFLPSVIQWQSCLGSEPHYRGYPCGMWTLFHVLTMASYQQHQEARPNTAGNPLEVLMAIKGYMKYFFGCQECSRNFLSMADNISREVTTWKESVMWLWSAHNKANKRLHKDITEDPQHPKVQFPTELMCPACRIPTPLDQDTSTPSWDPKKVFGFLLGLYSEKSIVFSIHLLGGDEAPHVTSALTMRLDWWEKKQREQDLRQVRDLRERRRLRSAEIKRSAEVASSYVAKSRMAHASVGTGSGFLSSWGLTQLDLSMCIVFYLFSTTIILFMYHHFIARRRLISCKAAKN